MPDGITFEMFTKPFHEGIKDRQVRMRRVAMYSLRAGGRVVKQEARRKAPVLKDTGAGYAKAGAYKRAFKERSKSGAAGPVAGEGRPVVGLLKQSISSSRQLKNLGNVEWSLKVGPRGPRVHLYAAKIEEAQPYMRPGYDAAVAALDAIWSNSVRKVWK